MKFHTFSIASFFTITSEITLYLGMLHNSNVPRPHRELSDLLSMNTLYEHPISEIPYNYHVSRAPRQQLGDLLLNKQELTAFKDQSIH